MANGHCHLARVPIETFKYAFSTTRSAYKCMITLREYKE